jgi:hypothetical protein
VGSFGDLSGFADGEFDGAVSTMALMDAPDLPAALGASHRVLRAGATLCFSVLHPCFVTPALRWLEDGHGGYQGLQVGRYFDQAPFVEHWRFRRPGADAVQPFEVPRFPRTLSDYLNAVTAAGFRIARIGEPRPSEDPAREYPGSIAGTGTRRWFSSCWRSRKPDEQAGGGVSRQPYSAACR